MPIIKGLEQATRNFRKIRDSIRADELEVALEAGSQIIESAAKQRAPVRKQRAPVRTGRLRDSIGHQTRQKRPRSVTRVIGPDRSGFYGSFLEFGTKRISPRPWLTPAYEASKDEAEQAARELIGSEIVKLALRLKK